MEALSTASERRLVDAALASWKAVIKRADKVFSALTDEQLQTPVGDGKNRLIYLWGT